MVLPIQYQMSVANPFTQFLEGQQFRENLLGQQTTRQINEFNLRTAEEDRIAQLEAAKAAQEAQIAGQNALEGLLNNPNPTTKDYLQAWVANPTMRDEVTSLRNMQNEDQNNALISKNTNLYAAAKSGNINVVRNLLQEELEAAQNSGDDQTVAINQAGIELLGRSPEQALNTIVAQSGLMLIGLKDPKFLEDINSALGAETPEQTEAFRTLDARAQAGGLAPGSSEYQQFILNNGEAPTQGFRVATPQEAAQFGAASGQFGPDGRFYPTEALEGAGFRQATPEEAASYGAAGGQFGPDGRFYAVNPPSGFNLTTNPDGTFSLSQGTGAGAAKPLNETQLKALPMQQEQGAL